ncbi:amino acid ABC transporter substrate-binding protein (PAAT family) [Trichococcus patagoniensis]|uniref:Amino acid ABC transporter substrate-binding protein (PAAT family) n=1 Tax=Trichococcus patagoniensis TaxID=382641 RepID=A0A2T5IHI4_9LACT|nr:transporter substrate-binding domain-containing protein [Trichococcus patagoniensis]PTQ83304.1 amino acid ABC transporter substrate-binding protein (PAAT family) [Trichococcus patagoniensis]
MKKGFMKFFLGTLSILALAACGNTSGTADRAAADADSALQEIKDSGKLVVGTCADYPPYEWHLVKDGEDKIIGFDIAIAQAIADELGVELEVIDMDFDGLIPALSTGEVDMIIAGMNPTEERKQSVDFTDIYYTQKDALVIKSEDAEDIRSENDLKKANLATQTATIQETYLLENFPDAEIKSVPKLNTAILYLVTGKADAVLMVETVARRYVEENEGLEIADFDVASTPNESAIAVAKDSGDFLDAVNEILDEMEDSGQIEELIRTNIEIMDENTPE